VTDERIHADHVDLVIAGWRDQMPDIVSPTLELSKRINRLAGRLQDAMRAETSAFGLTAADYEVLGGLRRVGEPYQLKPSELASSLLLTSGGISNVLRRLSAAGLIEREADSEDLRVAWVRLSPAGVQLIEQVMRAVARATAKLFAEVGDATVQAAADHLREVLVALGDHAPAPATPTGEE
jgi:DNA-binding MarR family transcriptional regulator